MHLALKDLLVELGGVSEGHMFSPNYCVNQDGLTAITSYSSNPNNLMTQTFVIQITVRCGCKMGQSGLQSVFHGPRQLPYFGSIFMKIPIYLCSHNVCRIKKILSGNFI